MKFNKHTPVPLPQPKPTYTIELSHTEAVALRAFLDGGPIHEKTDEDIFREYYPQSTQEEAEAAAELCWDLWRQLPGYGSGN